ncbi:MAG: hypothetical protein CM15mP93_09370 [Thiotrichaceae bacterium]|nr:MAG: hypothetical protein CM15mP93_09370 [Thiotrichaceae bacterium]
MMSSYQKVNSNLLIAKNNRPQPVFMLLDKSLLGSMKIYMENNGRKIDEWYFKENYKYIEFDDSVKYFHNLNTLDDLNDGKSKIIGISGYSGSGKTTTIINLIKFFKKSGIKIGIVKHAHHNFDVDVPGKDSYRFRENGADEVFVSSARRTVHIVENIDGNELTFNEVIEKIQRSKLDLVIVEGYKHEKFKKIEVYRKEVKKPMLCKNDKNIIAIISNDISNNDVQIPVFKLDDYKSIANFILKNL